MTRSAALIIVVAGTVAVIFFAIAFIYSPVSHRSFVTVVGTYRCVPNPCTVQPCQPGMVWAVIVEDTTYYLTVDGNWIWGCLGKSWDGYKPVEGDTVQVTGKVTEREDIWGNLFYEIEVYSLKEA